MKNNQLTTPEEIDDFWEKVTVLWECEDIEDEKKRGRHKSTSEKSIRRADPR